VEQEVSAWPFHDWNERIAAECYTPNTAASILDGDRGIAKVVNNFSQISFDFGPTLLTWLEKKAPETYQAILAADGESRRRFSGHGSALAHGYNHIILPLANSRDKATQISWGIQDFVHRFGERPEGMWLPETAVDLESLEIMASQGIKFTLLSPSQAKAVRVKGAHAWQDVSGWRIDPSQAYTLNLPSGKSMSLFFYDGPVSQAVSYEGLLHNGEKFIERLLSAYSSDRGRSELVHVVTDGEVYGHHHAHGEMALAFALERIESRALARVTNYGEFLERHPPSSEVQIVENSAWSCAHGVDRWRRHCGCHLARGDWSQEWRAHLRNAMDWLRDEVAERYEAKAGELVRDPWTARDDYIQVLLEDGSDESWARFQWRHAWRALRPPEEKTLRQLLEQQLHAMLMYTSCGWFFDDLSGLETRYVVGHAARVVELAAAVFHKNLEAPLVERLERAKSNIHECGSGATIYQKVVSGRRYAMTHAGRMETGRIEPSRMEPNPEHWLHGLVNELTEQFRATGEMTFETLERAVQRQKEDYWRDLETARRMVRTYPHLFAESLVGVKRQASGS
jgi:alpha-amylase/alpha-mannosidase (GH57 family)